MEIIEFDQRFISDVEGVSGSPIEPSEPAWKRALSPANMHVMGFCADDFRLEPPAQAPAPSVDVQGPGEAQEQGAENSPSEALPGLG